MPILIILTVFVTISVFMIIMNLLMPYVSYQKLSNIGLKYMFLVENYGYLSEVEKENLITELEIQGFDRNNIEVKATDVIKDYGEPIFLNLQYKYLMKFPKVSQGLNIVYEDKEIGMVVRKNGVSKK